MNPWDTEIQRAVNLHLSGKRDAACRVLRRSIERHAGVAALHSYLAGYLYLSEDAAGALPHAQAAVSLAPTKATPSRTLILALFKLGQAVPAISEARRYLGHTECPDEIEEWEHMIADAERFQQENEEDA